MRKWRIGAVPRICGAVLLVVSSVSLSLTLAADIVHDAEHYILKAQNGERWAAEDQQIDAKLAELRKKHGQPPNIVYLLWDDTAFGSVGFPALQKNFGYETPSINRMAAEGINFTRMYTEPSCTPTRAALLTGRHPVRHGMGVVGMPHEFSGLREEEVTIAEVLSEAGYATAFCGKGHLGDVEESYLHNQGFDEALFTPMNQITSLYSPMGNAANAVLGLHPEIYPPDPYQLDKPGLVPEGWVQSIEGRKGEQGAEWCGTSSECFSKVDTECEKRIIEFIRRNAKAGKPFHAQYWPNFLNFLEPEMPKRSVAGLKVAGSFPQLDAFIGQIMDELKELGIAENTLFIAMADNGPMVHSPPPGWGMLPMIYRGGKGDFTEGGVRTPAFAWWPGVIDEGQVVGDTHGRRDYVHIYAGHELGATVKGRYKRHWIGAGDVAASGMPEAYYDLYMDPREENPQLVPMIHFQGQFNQMRARHELMKMKYPDVPNAKGIPYTGLSNARPETLAIAVRVKALADPFAVRRRRVPGVRHSGQRLRRRLGRVGSVMNKTASRRGFLKTSALAGTGFAALAASGCKGDPAEEQEPAVKVAGYAYDRVRAVMDGRVGVEGAAVDFHVEDIYALNRYAFGPEPKYDVTELGLIPFVSKYINEDFRAYTLVPVFVSRIFRHRNVFVHVDAGIEKPEDLRGKRVGTPGYGMSANTWIRGFLLDEYGVKASEMRWIETTKSSDEGALNTGRFKYFLPEGFPLEKGPPGVDESDLIIAGDCDALITAITPRAFLDGHPKVKRLFPDFQAAEEDYFRKTRLFPIMHVVAIRTDLLETDPGMPKAVFEMYSMAKQQAYADLETTTSLKITLPWVTQEFEDTRRLMGENFWPYGIEANRRELERVMRYAHEQGLVKRRLEFEELFAPSTLRLLENEA